MRARSLLFSPFSCLFVLVLPLAGCHSASEKPGSPEQVAREALGVKQEGQERTVEAKRDVIVDQTTQVIDRNTGEVLKTEEKKTPVTITEQKTVERDVDVNAGKPNTTVK